jgi:hypothetical protein
MDVSLSAPKEGMTVGVRMGYTNFENFSDEELAALREKPQKVDLMPWIHCLTHPSALLTIL